MSKQRISTTTETSRRKRTIKDFKLADKPETKDHVCMLKARSVVYLANDKSWEGYETVQSILKCYGVTVEKRDVLQLLPRLRKRLNLDSLPLPMIFIGGKYIGGVNELMQLKETGQLENLVFGLPEIEDDVCRDCGGYKFILFLGRGGAGDTSELSDGMDFITCPSCDGTHLSRELRIGGSKLHICLEAADTRRRHMYIIYSVHEIILGIQHANPPTIRTETVIRGYPSMGCGVYDSKIIFAGGQRSLDRERHTNCITFDMTNKITNKTVNYQPFIPMDKGKFKPLVFQLNKRLYVCGSEYYFKSRNDADFLSIEFYSPAMKKRWRTVSNIFERPRGSNDSLANYACVVFGNSCLMSVPYEDATYITHCNYLESVWVKHSDASLPFTGLATFYYQDGFSDFVMIYFSKGVVRVCKFDFSCFGDSTDLFTVKSTGENMHGYFADFGKGYFCLTAFDESYIYVTTFVVTRDGTPSDPLKVSHRILSSYNLHFDQFSIKGRKVTSVLGCYVPTRNEEAKLGAEKLAAIHYKNYMKVNDDYDPWDTDNIKSLILED